MGWEPDRVVLLIRKYRMHTIKEEEKEELQAWLKEEGHLRIFQRLISPERENTFLNELRAYDSSRAYRNFTQHIRLKKRTWPDYLRIAALFLLPLVAGALLYEWGNHTIEGEKVENRVSMESLAGRKAILTLTDGRQIAVIGSESSEVIADAGGFLKLDSTGLVYEKKTSREVLKMSEVYVPQKGEFSLVLSDGTKVYLNSDSRLTYPLAFGPDKREVFVTGEAYFEVAPDTTRSFIVRTEGLDIRVLGTSFNVNAYPGAEQVSATLASGRIKASCNGQEYNLECGQQIRRDLKTGKTDIENVNTEIYTCWKDGYYYFEELRLEDIMEKLSRWYGIHTFFMNPELKDIEFTGRLHRYEDIETVLRKFEQTRNIRFSLKENTVTVKAN